jgi:zinc protease
MTRFRALLPLAVAAIAFGLGAGLPAPAAAAPVSVKPPLLQVHERRLANGLRVLLYEDHTVPVASIEVWYHVGGKNERPGRSGFAHLFEHLMFKGSAHVGPEEHGHFIESIGGRENATTDWDRTLYFETIPSNYLERILWMEADRMRSLDVSEANFRAEREVVKEERRLRIDDPPFGRLHEIVFAKTFTTHPYRLLPIGSIADLDAATLADVREFYRTWYVPNNATLVVAGDLDPARTLQWIETWFGTIPAGPPLPRAVAPEPEQTAERREVAYDAKAPLPAVILTFHVPAARDPDLYPLQVASRILSEGESSRLYRKLVYERQLAVAAGGQALTLEDPGVFFFFAFLQQGQKPEAGEAAIEEEIDRLRAEPVTAGELEKARNQIVARLVFQRERAEAKADAIGRASVILGDAERVNHDLDRFEKVTAADVQRVARKYFTRANRTTVFMLPAAMRPAAGPAAAAPAPQPGAAEAARPSQPPGGRQGVDAPPAPPAAAGATGAPTAMGAAAARGGASAGAPAPLPPRELRFPAFEQKTLPNGLRLVVIERHTEPQVGLRLLLPAGRIYEPAGRAGLANATSDLLTQGTASRSAQQIAAAVDGAGAMLTASSDADFGYVSTAATADQLELALDLLGDVVLHPAFPAAEVERWRRQTLSALELDRANPGYLADAAVQRLVFGSHPYAHPPHGTPRSVRELTRGDLLAFHRDHYLPNGSILVVVGDFQPARALAAVERVFGGWARGEVPRPPALDLTAGQQRQVLVIDKPDAVQTQIRASQPALAYTDPDYFTAKVYATVLGGNSSARLFTEIRRKRGLAYGAYCDFGENLVGGSFTAETSTKTGSTAEALRLTLEEVAAMGRAPVPETELQEARTYLGGAFSLELESAREVAGRVLAALGHGLGRDFLDGYRDRIAAVSAAAVQRFAAGRIQPQRMAVVLVGNAAAFGPEVARQLGAFETIPAAELDPLAPGLRRPAAAAPPPGG